MQRYGGYKPSGVEWLGDVPTHWEVQPLRAVTSLKSDKNRSDLPVLSVYREYGVILKDSRDDNHNATSLDTSTYKSVEPGDLVVNKMKAWQGSMGVSAHEGIVSPAYITCKTRADRVRPAYLHYLLRSSPLIGVYNSLCYGVRVGQWDMHYEDFKQIRIPLPPQEEQDRIVAFLDQKTAEIEAAITKKGRLIEMLIEQSENLINHAVTRGLSSSIESRFSGHNFIGDIPSNWNIRRLKFLSRKIGSGVTPSGGAQNYLDDGVMFIRSQNVYFDGLRTDDITYIPEKIHKAMGGTQVQKNDVLLNITGASIGRACVYRMDAEANVNQHVCIIRPVKQLDPEFLCCVLNSKVGSQQIWLSQNGSSREGLNFFDLKSFYIPLPSLNEQVLIGAFCRNSIDTTRAVVNSITNEIAILKQFLLETIAAVVTGERKV